MIQDYINKVSEAIKKADATDTKLTIKQLSIGGMSSMKTKIFLNELIDSETEYLEVGVYRGSTFVSALYNNSFKSATAIDNFSQQWDEFGVSNENVFLQNCKDSNVDNIKVIIGDCFNVPDELKKETKSINLYFYDGDHKEEDQEKAISYWIDNLADEFILIIDDWNSEEVKLGTRKGILNNNIKVHQEWILPSSYNGDTKNWWNGLYVAVCEKGDSMHISFNKEEKKNPLTISQTSNTRLWVVDDFYEDPYAVRDYALKQEYFDKENNDGGYIGRRTRGQYLFPGLKEKFEQVMNRKITRWQEYGMNGRFQMGVAGDPQVFHCDDQLYAGMLYLTPDAPFECGTGFYAHKATKIRHSSHPNIMSTFRWQTTLDATPYEPVDVVGNVFNRLVIFDAHLIHSASEYFGWELSNCRLWQIFFFDAEVNY